MDERLLIRKVNFLTFYAILGNLILVLFVSTAFKNTDKKETLDELTVKRINIVDETGKNPRMVIRNENRQHSGIINGKKYHTGKDHLVSFFSIHLEMNVVD